jgi:hypothetical protein
MYKLLLVSDRKDVLEAFDLVQNWEYNGFRRPHIRQDIDGARECLKKHHADAISIAVSASEEEKLLEMLRAEYPLLPIFEAGTTPEKVSFEVSKDDTIPHYSINVTQEAKAEMKKNLSEYYAKRNEGKEEADQIPVPTDEELDKEVAERLEFEYKQEADARLTRDIRNYFVEKAAIELPEDYLKRWLFQMNKGKYTMEQIEKEFPSFLEDFRWQLVRDFLMEKYDLKVTREDIEKAAEGYVAYQYAMYGIGNVPEEMIKEAAGRILAEGKQNGMLQEQVENNKVMDALKSEITIKPKKIALSKFKELK